MDQPKIAKKGSYFIDLEEGKTYFWCQCGESNNQPFCDGSHKTTSYKPIKFTADSTGKVYLCGCKRSQNVPYCDGTHKKL